jgi:hypothetical protein
LKERKEEEEEKHEDETSFPELLVAQTLSLSLSHSSISAAGYFMAVVSPVVARRNPSLHPSTARQQGETPKP